LFRQQRRIFVDPVLGHPAVIEFKIQPYPDSTELVGYEGSSTGAGELIKNNTRFRLKFLGGFFDKREPFGPCESFTGMRRLETLAGGLPTEGLRWDKRVVMLTAVISGSLHIV